MKTALNEIIAERKRIVKALNKSGYSARKFSDSETGILLSKRKEPDPYARLIFSEKGDSWQLICYGGVTDFINPMKIVAIVEKTILKQ